MKVTILLIAILTMNFAIAQDIVQKEFDGVIYELKHEETRSINGEEYSDSYWMSLDGNSTKTILCRIPQKCRDIKIESLTTKCIYNEKSS